MHIWLNIITNCIKIAKKNSIKKPFLEIIINENSIEIKDNCKGFDKDTLKIVHENRQNGLGLKIS